MDFSSPPRPRVRGKPFKLFTDDLPKIDFNKSHLRDYGNGPAIGKRFPYEQLKRQIGLNEDKLSLPSLDTPTWDTLSTPDSRRPRSDVNIFNPNIAQLNKKIRRRHTTRESRERVVLDQRFRRANDDLSVKSGPETVENKHEKSDDSVKEAFARTSSTRSFRSKGVKVGDAEDKKNSEKPKSILQQLLDESARDSARRKMVEEGFKLYRQGSVKRKSTRAIPNDNEQIRTKAESSDSTNTLKTSETVLTESKGTSKGRQDVEHVEAEAPGNLKERSGESVPEPDNKSEGKDVNVKPGILKYNVGIGNTKIKHERNLKPRLIHQDNIKDLPFDDVQVTVHAEVPMNRLNALLVTRVNSKKPRTKRRVNFDKLKEDNSTLENEVVTDPRKAADKVGFDDKYRIDGSLSNEKVAEVDSYPRSKVSLIRKRDSMPRKSRNRPFDLKSMHTSSFTSYNRISPKEETSSGDNILKFEKLTENLKDPRIDPFWKEIKEPVADTNSGENESLNRQVETGDTTDAACSARVPSKLSRKSSKHRKPGFNRKVPHIPSRFTPSDTLSSSTTGSIFGNSDFDSLSDMQSFFEDIDGFPDEIDRSLLGEDLIKAYRLWDRKRKAFPGGLRKIEAPLDQSEDWLFPKSFGTVRTYRIPNQTQEMKASAENKESMTSVVIGTF